MNAETGANSNVVTLPRASQHHGHRAWLRGAWGWLFEAWRDVCSRTCPSLLDGDDLEQRSARWLAAALSDFTKAAIPRWDERWLKRLLDIAIFRLTGDVEALFDRPPQILAVPTTVLSKISRPSFRPGNKGAEEIRNILSDAAFVCALSIEAATRSSPL